MSEPTKQNADQENADSLARMDDPDSLVSIRHKLRTPLNQILGYTEMIQEEFGQELAAEISEDLKKIHTAGGQLLSMIQDGLAAWKFEYGKVDLNSMRFEARTPLNLIIGYGELLEEIAQEEQLDGVVADLKKITGAARNLQALFDSISFPESLDVQRQIAKDNQPDNTVFIRKTDSGNGEQEAPGHILVVDDNEMNRDMLGRRLENQGFAVTEAENGQEAIDLLKDQLFDLILLDVQMPGLNGYDTLKLIKEDFRTQNMPVIMISAVDEIDNAVKCIEFGAEDFVSKPFNPVLLKARIASSLAKKQVRDQDLRTVTELRIEREKYERLLLDILPKPIMERVRDGEANIADDFAGASVLMVYLDLPEGFARAVTTEKYVHLINDLCSGYDWLANLYGLERIRSEGNQYMAVAGVPAPTPDHAVRAAKMALELDKVTSRFNKRSDIKVKTRVCLGSGPCKAGVIGRKQFMYHVWGDAVDSARNLRNCGEDGSVLVSHSMAELLSGKADLAPLGEAAFFLKEVSVEIQ